MRTLAEGRRMIDKTPDCDIGGEGIRGRGIRHSEL